MFKQYWWVFLVCWILMWLAFLAGVVVEGNHNAAVRTYEVRSWYRADSYTKPDHEVQCSFVSTPDDDLDMCVITDRPDNIRCTVFWPDISLFCEPNER
jgi:hypothetical protein